MPDIDLPPNSGREFESHGLHVGSFRACALEYVMVVYSWMLVHGERGVPEVHATKSARINGLVDKYIVGFTALPYPPPY